MLIGLAIALAGIVRARSELETATWFFPAATIGGTIAAGVLYTVRERRRRERRRPR